MSKFWNQETGSGGASGRGGGNPYLENVLPYMKAIKIGLAVLALGIVFFSSYYTVAMDEEGVVTTFDKYSSTVSSGAQWKIPFVQKVILLKTKRILQEEFGLSRKTEEGGYHSNISESLMLTGDLNVADVKFVVQYQITNSSKYLFKAKTPSQNIRDISESVIRRLVGDRMFSEVLTTGRMEISTEAKKMIQDLLTQYDQGTTIVNVQLQDINPPERVRDAFNEVSKAKQEQEQMINMAEQQYNKEVPKAEGEAQEAISIAEGYATQVKNQALGDVAKFDKIQAEYKLAPEITKKRLYLETMQEIYKDRKIMFVGSNLKGSMLPLYNLNKKEDKGSKNE